MSSWRPGRVASQGPLAERGVGAGDRVALALPAGADYCAALHGCFLLGAVAVPIDLRLAQAEREARLHTARVVVEGPLRRAIARGSAARRDRRRRDPDAHLRYHRGTQAGPATLWELARERARFGGRARVLTSRSGGYARSP